MTASSLDHPRSQLPPVERYNLLRWLHQNLFSTWYNSLLTIFVLGLVLALFLPVLRWIFTEARWEVIVVNFRLLMVGQYPASQTWRVWLCLQLLAANVGITWGVWVRGRRLLGVFLLVFPLIFLLYPNISASGRWNLVSMDAIALAAYGLGRLGGRGMRRMAVTLWVLYFPLVIVIIRGVDFGGEALPVVTTNLWGGLLLTFLLTIVGISLSFPLGIMLALGRRSTLPAVRWVSVTYIEVVRGVPLVTILFMASTMVPLFFPTGTRPDPVLRAMIGITLFTAAYLAENVRGGLQAIPHGQFEAAHAIGLNGFQTMAFIILPQALRTVIPVIMGLFIALFKDTSLVATIGLLELLGISRSVLAQPQFVGYQREVYLFISLIYWVFSYFLSYVSQRLETSLGVGER